MQISDLLAQTGGLESIARELGIDHQQAATAAEALSPALLNGFQQSAKSDSGGIMDMLGQLGGSGMLDQVLAPEATDVGSGNQVLGQIFGSRDASRAVAHDAAAKTGLDPDLLKKMLPLLAMVVGGVLSRGNATGASAGSTGGLGGMLGGLFGGGGGQGAGLGGLGKMLDANGDGNALDDILRMVAKAGR